MVPWLLVSKLDSMVFYFSEEDHWSRSSRLWKEGFKKWNKRECKYGGKDFISWIREMIFIGPLFF